MLIALRATPGELEAIGEEQLRDTVSEMLRAHRRGNHLVVIDRDTAKWLLQNIAFTIPERTILERLIQDFTQYGQLKNSARCIVSVDLSHLSFPEWRNGQLIVGLHHIRLLPICEPAILLSEDAASDGKLYRLIMERIFLENFGLQINFEIRHGGGDQIAAIIEGILEEKRIAITFIDSDRKFPADTASEKYKKINSICENSEWKATDTFCLPCHEIENLIPLEVIRTLPLAVQKSALISALMKIEAVEETSNIPFSDRFHLFFDLKLGAHEELDEWTKKKLAMGGNIEYVGFGNNIITQSLASPEVIRNIFKVIKKDSWLSVFSDLFKSAGWFGVAARRSIT